MAIIFIGIFLWAIISLNSAVNPRDQTKVNFNVSEGQSIDTIATNLESVGLIGNKNVFVLYTKLGPAKGRLIPGKYVLSPSMSSAKIVEYLSSGKIATKRVTFQEGLNINEISRKWSRNGLGTAESFVEATKQQGPYNQAFLQYRLNTESLEGYLFPATYDIAINSSPEDQINSMLDAFAKNVLPKLPPDVASSKKLGELITLASVVEKEAKTTEDRRLAASVFYNRLKIDMKLESDVTINYVTGKTRTQASDLKINSPYNSYLYKGLPPTPICNPGIDAIIATLNPAESNYFYFIADNTGKLHFAETFEQHQKNIDKYLK